MPRRTLPLVLVVWTVSSCLLVSGGNAAVLETPPESVDAVRAVLKKLAFVPLAGDKTFRVPSSSMEPTLHCAKPAVGCRAETSDRIVVRAYGGAAPTRGDVIAFRTLPLTRVKCGAGGTFLKRVVGLPGDRVEVRMIGGNGWVFING